MYELVGLNMYVHMSSHVYELVGLNTSSLSPSQKPQELGGSNNKSVRIDSMRWAKERYNALAEIRCS